MANSRMTLSYRDYEGQTSTVAFEGVALTGANYVAQTQLMADLTAATEGIVLGLMKKETRIASQVELTGESSANPLARRELKALAMYHFEGSTVKGSMEIPCIDLSLTNVNAKGEIDITTALSPGAVFKAAFEAFVRLTEPDGTVRTAVLDRLLIEGRNI